MRSSELHLSASVAWGRCLPHPPGSPDMMAEAGEPESPAAQGPDESSDSEPEQEPGSPQKLIRKVSTSGQIRSKVRPRLRRPSALIGASLHRYVRGENGTQTLHSKPPNPDLTPDPQNPDRFCGSGFWFGSLIVVLGVLRPSPRLSFHRSHPLLGRTLSVLFISSRGRFWTRTGPAARLSDSELLGSWRGLWLLWFWTRPKPEVLQNNPTDFSSSKTRFQGRTAAALDPNQNRFSVPELNLVLL